MWVRNTGQGMSVSERVMALPGTCKRRREPHGPGQDQVLMPVRGEAQVSGTHDIEAWVQTGCIISSPTAAQTNGHGWKDQIRATYHATGTNILSV